MYMGVNSHLIFFSPCETTSNGRDDFQTHLFSVESGSTSSELKLDTDVQCNPALTCLLSGGNTPADATMSG